MFKGARRGAAPIERLCLPRRLLRLLQRLRLGCECVGLRDGMLQAGEQALSLSTWLEPTWLEPKWLEPKWLRFTYLYNRFSYTDMLFGVTRWHPFIPIITYTFI